MPLKKTGILAEFMRRADVRSRCRRYWRTRCLARATGPFVYRLGGDPAICDPGVLDSVNAYLGVPTDFWERRIFHAWLRPGDCVIDAGANFGLFTWTAAALVERSGKVIAVEPTPRLAEHLRRGSTVLGGAPIEVRQAALGRAAGRARFAFAREGDTAVSQSLVASSAPEGTETVAEVEVVSLQQLMPPNARPALVKVDVEGAEFDALRGAPAEWLTDKGPLWVVECQPETLQRFGCTADDVAGMFPTDCFHCLVIAKFAAEGGGDLAPVPLDEVDWPKAKYWNLVAVPKGPGQENRREKLRRFFPTTL